MQKAIDRYRIDVNCNGKGLVKELGTEIIEQERGDSLLEWGAKLFYFDRRKCLEVANFASKFTLFLVDIKVDDLPNIGYLISSYMFDIFKDDHDTTALLARLFDESPIFVFSKLQDKRCINHLNHTLWHFADDGYILHDYIEDGILHTRELNKSFNTGMLVTKVIDGEKQFLYPAELLKSLLKQRYQDDSNSCK